MLKILIFIIFLVVVTAQAQDNNDNAFMNVTTDCWATLYSEPDYRGERITLFDTVNLPAIPKNPGINGKVRSIEVGPGATLVLFGKRNYQDLDHILLPGADLPSFKQLPWNEVKSLRMECVD